MRKSLLIITTLASASMVCAEPILFNIIDRRTVVNASVADFTAAGVTEDLSGATLSNVRGKAIGGESMFGSNGVSLTLEHDAVGPYANASTMTGAGSNLLQNYIALRDNGISNTATIGGLSSELISNTDYILYLWGIGDKTKQNSTFTYGSGAPITVGVTDPTNESASTYMAKFTFKTGRVVADSLRFEWDRSRQSPYGGFNAFAIVKADRTSIPEPGIYALIAGVLALGSVMIRRRP